MTTPLSVYLPFNRDCLGGGFVPAKRGAKPPEATGHWLIVQEQRLIVVPDGAAFRLPAGSAPAGFARQAELSGLGDRSPAELAGMSADEGKLSLDIRTPSRR